MSERPELRFVPTIGPNEAASYERVELLGRELGVLSNTPTNRYDNWQVISSTGRHVLDIAYDSRELATSHLLAAHDIGMLDVSFPEWRCDCGWTGTTPDIQPPYAAAYEPNRTLPAPLCPACGKFFTADAFPVGY